MPLSHPKGLSKKTFTSTSVVVAHRPMHPSAPSSVTDYSNVIIKTTPLLSIATPAKWKKGKPACKIIRLQLSTSIPSPLGDG